MQVAPACIVSIVVRMTDNDLTINVTVRVEEESIAAVDELAHSERRSRAQMIRILLEEAVQARALAKSGAKA